MPKASANAWASSWSAWGRRAVKGMWGVVSEWYHYATTAPARQDLIELRQARRLRRPRCAARPHPQTVAPGPACPAPQETEERERVFIGKTLDFSYA